MDKEVIKSPFDRCTMCKFERESSEGTSNVIFGLKLWSVKLETKNTKFDISIASYNLSNEKTDDTSSSF